MREMSANLNLSVTLSLSLRNLMEELREHSEELRRMDAPEEVKSAWCAAMSRILDRCVMVAPTVAPATRN